MRLHLVTSRAPPARAVSSHDKVVLMELKTSKRLSQEIIDMNPSTSEATLLVLDEIGYPKLVSLVAESDGAIAW